MELDLEDRGDHRGVDDGWVPAGGQGVEDSGERGRRESEEGKVGGWRNKDVVEKVGVGTGEGGGTKEGMAVDGKCGGDRNRGQVPCVDVTL